MEAECLTKTLSYLNLNISRTKLSKQAAKSPRIKKSYRTYWLFSFYSDNWQKLTIFPQKLVIFNIYHIFAPFMKLRGCRFLYFFSLCDVRNEAVVLLLEHSSPKGVKQKKHIKKRQILDFKPLLQEIQLKNLTIRKIFWSSNI